MSFNNTFYRFAATQHSRELEGAGAGDFRFSVKAPRTITLFRRLKDAADITKRMLETISALGDRLGVVLYRLPDDMKKDLKRLESFLKTLPPDPPAVFDFRHPTWFDDEDVLELLRSENRASAFQTQMIGRSVISTRPPIGVTCACDEWITRRPSYVIGSAG